MKFKSLFLQIEKLLTLANVSDLKRAALTISERYRRLETTKDFRLYHEIERLAYIAMRMPATVAVLDKVLKELPAIHESLSLLDVGSGPGSVLWAASALHLKKVTCVEHERGWVDLAQKLWQGSEHQAQLKVEWVIADLAKAKLPLSDLVVASYSLNELSEKDLEKALASLLEATGRYFVWVEPGTSESFNKMSRMRERLLLDKSLRLLAPCRSQLACPYVRWKEETQALSQAPSYAPGWCHFSARLERPSFHRLIKDVKMSYEDEKYCYLIFEKTKRDEATPSLRLLEDPKARGGHVRLVGCNEQSEIEELVVSKKEEDYKLARKLSWGDLWLKSSES